VAKEFETPYGKVSVERHIYQSSSGGETFCPMEYEARTIGSSTPRFANIISFKYANTSVSGVARDLEVGNRRQVSNDFVHETSRAVADIFENKESIWSYDLPRVPGKVASIGISLDGTCVNIRPEGWKQVMVGTIALYDEKGERLYTQYLGESPEAGKGRFHERFTREIEGIIRRFSSAAVIGVADGAKDNWTFLEKFGKILCLDFYHASEYVSRVAKAAFSDEKKKHEWLSQGLHELKHTVGFAEKLIKELDEMRTTWSLSTNSKDEIRICQNYFENNKHRMIYAENTAKHFPIGSGVVEAGCKVLVKERLCCSGMRWTTDGCGDILRLRSMALTDGRWEQFWQKVDRFGYAA
jgi:hypothetical protein